MTIQELNKKIWYRLLKVIYVFIFLFSFLLLVYIGYVNYSKPHTLSLENTKIDCKLGIKRTISAKEGGIQMSDDFWNIKTLQNACGITTEEINAGVDLIKQQNITDTNNQSYGGRFWNILNLDSSTRSFQQNLHNEQLEVHPIYYTYHNWRSLIRDSIILLLILVVIFEVIRKVFYYIWTGKFRPLVS